MSDQEQPSEPPKKPEPALKSAGKTLLRIISSIVVILILVVVSLLGICAIYSMGHH